MRLAGLVLCLFSFAGLFQKQIPIGCGPHKDIGQATAIFTRVKTSSQIAVQTNPLRLVGDTTDGLYLSPNFIILGRKLVAPPSIELEFISYSPQRRFMANRRLEIKTQNRAVFSQTLTLATCGRSNEGTITEVLVTKIPYRNFLSLVQESSLTLMVGEKRIELTEVTIDALRDLKRMADSGVLFLDQPSP